MKKTTVLLSLLAIVALNACKNMGFEKTKSGLQYKIIKGKKGAKLEQGDIVKFQYTITYKDSLIVKSYNFLPGYDQVDSVGRYHDFSEFLTKLSVEDSAVSLQLYDTLQKNTPYGVPPYMKKGDKQQMTIKVLAVFKNQGGKTSRDFAIEDYQKEMENYKGREVAVIEKYLTQKGIKASKVGSGVFVAMEQDGTGIQADSGKTVGIKYSGYNFEGKFFDSNVDTTKQTQKHGLETFYFVAKQQGAIQGMLEGITAFKLGGKGKLYIPSILAYGPQGSPPAIQPNENLIFDIEVVEIKDTPAQPEMPMPSGGQ